MLDLVEEAFDEVARFVQISAEADWILAVRFGRDVRPCAARADCLPQCVSVVALVSQQQGSGRKFSDHFLCTGHICVLACGQLQPDGSSLSVDQRVDLRRQTASGATQTSILIPLFAVAPC